MTDEYEWYLKSPQWRKVSKWSLMMDGYKCALCGDTASETHHKRYVKTWDDGDKCYHYHESYADLMSLCHDCHKEIHSGETLKTDL